MTVRQQRARVDALLTPKSIPLADGDLLLAHALGVSQEQLFTYPERDLTLAEQNYTDYLLAQRMAGYSVAVLVGYKDFYSLRFAVSAETLIPRPESELLVDLATAYLKKKQSGAVLDIGTGSGNLIITLATMMRSKRFTYYAIDRSPQALAVAKRNALSHRSDINFIQSNLFTAIPKIKFRCVMANLPYLTSEQMKEPSIQREPIIALWGGARGTEIYHAMLHGLPPYLEDEFVVLMEIDPQQKNELSKLAASFFPAASIHTYPDLAGHDRVIAISDQKLDN